MELKYIREFVSLAETGSYFETAERLFITTSSLSRHIKALEEELGMPLFDRTTRKVELNRHGRLFLPYAKQFVKIDDECAMAFDEEVMYSKGAIGIGSIPMMKAYNISRILQQYRQNNKNVIINIHEADSTPLAEILRKSEIDFAFLRNKHISVEEFETIPISQDHLVAVLPKNHPLARQKKITIDQLENESLLLISKNSYMYRLCTDLCRSAGFQPKVVFTSQRAENLVELIGQGTGIALLMSKPVAPILPDNLTLVDIEPRVTPTVFLAYLKDRKFNTACKRFLVLVKTVPFEEG
ncbi:MAG: LysR family transcriptional regulator [Clostridia bacterium]|nr:LysR family transcriptional regulator [Clostridia bacterium]